MKPTQLQGMFEAVRLTRSGRLADATALIQELLSNPETGPPVPARSADAKPTDLAEGAVIDLKPHQRRWRTPRSEVGNKLQPSVKPSDGRFEDKLYADASGQLTYKLYVPAGYVGVPLPLVVMLHGCTQSPEDFAAGTAMNVLAEEQNFFVAYPAQSRSANISACWNWFNAGDQKKGRGEPALLAGIVRQVIEEHAIDARRVYVAGLSAGGAMAAILGMNYPDLFAAIGVHSGLACGSATDLATAFGAMRRGLKGAPKRRAGRPVPTIVFHGDQDAIVHPANGSEVIAQFGGEGDFSNATSTKGTTAGGLHYTCSVQYDGAGRPMLEQWVIHGAGHAWFGGSTDGSYTEPRGPDASGEMIRFFMEHTMQ